jgi:hypothetical protein
MAQDLSSKQVGFVNRYKQAVVNLLSDLDALSLLYAEWNADAYATGASPAGNNITDSIVQQSMPYATAFELNQAVGAVVAIETTVASNRGYLEALRP